MMKPRVENDLSMDRLKTKNAWRRINVASRGVLCLLVGLLWASGLRAQTAEEHASHHPAQAAGASPAAAWNAGR